MPTRGGVILPNEPAAAGKPEVAGFFRSGSTVRHAAGIVQVDPDTHDPVLVGGYPIGFHLFGENIAYPAANERWPRIMWRVPVGKRFYPTALYFGGVTAGGYAEVCHATRWGTYDLGASAFLDTGGDFSALHDNAGAVNVAGSRRFHSRLAVRVRTTLSAVATNLSITTLLPRSGASFNALAALAASHAAGRVVHVSPSAGSLGQFSSGTDPATTSVDFGYIGVSGVAESPATAATGFVDIFGETVLASGRHPANDTTPLPISEAGRAWIDAGEFLIVYGAQPAVTAYLRDFVVTGYLIDVPA
jgi:hypothetical protein